MSKLRYQPARWGRACHSGESIVGLRSAGAVPQVGRRGRTLTLVAELVASELVIGTAKCAARALLVEAG
eukprot:1230983-Prymnesium_polylepis.2